MRVVVVVEVFIIYPIILQIFFLETWPDFIIILNSQVSISKDINMN